MKYSIEASERQAAGLAAAASVYNDNARVQHDAEQAQLEEADRVSYVPLTPAEYLAARVTDVLDSYAGGHKVGVITPFAFVKRFTTQEYQDIVALGQKDGDVAGLLQDLAEAKEVRLYSDKVINGLAYLTSKGLLASGRAADIASLT